MEGAYDQFRVFGLKDSSEPFYSLTYAIAPILKVFGTSIDLSLAMVLVGISDCRYELVLE